MKEITNREDIHMLVSSFYKNVRKDSLLGPIFNGHIAEDHWPIHIEKLTDFWMTTLFGIPCFKGNPTHVHKRVDKNLEYTIEQNHFGQWLNLWFRAIDSLYEGELAQLAKDKARRMATGQFMAIWNHRPQLLK